MVWIGKQKIRNLNWKFGIINRKVKIKNFVSVTEFKKIDKSKVSEKLVYMQDFSLAMGVQVQWAQESIIPRRTTFSTDLESLGKLQHSPCHPLPKKVKSLRSPCYFPKDVKNI